MRRKLLQTIRKEMQTMKKLIDIFVPDQSDNPVLVSAISFQDSATWPTAENCMYIDERLLQCFAEKLISPAFQKYDKTKILIMIGNFLQSKEYELNGLYESTQFEYGPIANYDMTESSRDEDRATTSGDSTESSTSFDSTTQKDTGKTVSSGTASNTNIHSLQRSGNIGVTSSQQLIEAQRGVLTFDFIQYVADLINENFCSTFWIPDRDHIGELEVLL